MVKQQSSVLIALSWLAHSCVMVHSAKKGLFLGQSGVYCNGWRPTRCNLYQPRPIRFGWYLLRTMYTNPAIGSLYTNSVNPLCRLGVAKSNSYYNEVRAVTTSGLEWGGQRNCLWVSRTFAQVLVFIVRKVFNSLLVTQYLTPSVPTTWSFATRQRTYVKERPRNSFHSSSVKIVASAQVSNIF